MPRRSSKRLKGGAQPKCSEVIGEGATGIARKVCEDPGCTNCLVVKEGRGNSFIDLDEVQVTQEAWKIAKASRAYKYHVSEFVDAKIIGRTKDDEIKFSLETKFVENYGDFQNVFAKQDFITKEILAHFMIQTVLTMDYLWTKGNLLHMDIKPANILAAKWPIDSKGSYIAEILPVASSNDKIKFMLPGVPYWATLIDFGNAVYYNNDYREWVGSTIYDGKPWEGQCYVPSFDIFRLLDSVDRLSFRMTPDAMDLFRQIVASSFISPNFMKDFKKIGSLYDGRFGMLTGLGCMYFKDRIADGTYNLRTHADLILNCGDLVRGYVMNTTPRRSSRSGRRSRT